MQGAAALHREIIPPPGRSVKLLDRTMPRLEPFWLWNYGAHFLAAAQKLGTNHPSAREGASQRRD